jgi:hypothetical protein
LTVELGDWGRFRPESLGPFLGLTPSEKIKRREAPPRRDQQDRQHARAPAPGGGRLAPTPPAAYERRARTQTQRQPSRSASPSRPQRPPAAQPLARARGCGVKKFGSGCQLGQWSIHCAERVWVKSPGADREEAELVRPDGRATRRRLRGCQNGWLRSSAGRPWASVAGVRSMRSPPALGPPIVERTQRRGGAERPRTCQRARNQARLISIDRGECVVGFHGGGPPHRVPAPFARTRRPPDLLRPKIAARCRAGRTPGRAGTQTSWGRGAAAPAPAPTCATRSRSWSRRR